MPVAIIRLALDQLLITAY